MPAVTMPRPDLSSHALFLGTGLILILVALVLSLGKALKRPTIGLGNCRIMADVARTDQEKARGLAGRASIDPNQAMIFPFEHEQPYFWMKGMLTAIDIVWVKGNEVVKIDPSLPLDEGAAQYQPPVPIDWVIELAAGRASQCGAQPGTKITGLRS